MRIKECLIIFFVAMIPLIYCSCGPLKKIHQHKPCYFHIQCRSLIRSVSLPINCQGSPNYPVDVEVNLIEAFDKFDARVVDIEILNLITSLKASGSWPQTNLTILENMPRLRSLFLVGNDIKEINGTPLFGLSHLEFLDLSHNFLSDIEYLFQFESYPNKLRHLLLAYNSIDTIPADTFGELTSLVELDLSHNLISDLSDEPFSNLTALEILKLNNNRIKELNGAVNNLQNLKHLFLRANQLSSIDVESLKIIDDLETFDISWNQLKYLKSSIFYRHWGHFRSNSVCKIILAENQLTSIPKVTMKELIDRYSLKGRRNINKNNNLDVVTEIDLSKNKISNIEYDAFNTLNRIVSIDLSVNKLTHFIINPKDLMYVKYLNLSTNLISNLPFDYFWSMDNLQNLDLSHNNLDDIPDDTFTKNFKLKNINMTYNEIAKLDNFRIKLFHPDGGVLDLSMNSIYRLSINRPYGDGLSMLILKSNNISEATQINLHDQKDLTYLDISKNYIKELDDTSLRLPITLTYLDLSCNIINSLGPASFHTVSNLKTLRLSHNKISKLEYGTFQQLISLVNLDLSFNNISYLDSKLMMDMKSLQILSLRFNGLLSMEYKSWLGHKYDLIVYLEGNSFTCEWLGTALSDYNNGYSRMKPSAREDSVTGHSLEGIPCINKEVGEIKSTEVLADERLLVIAQKILEAIREQNSYFKKYVWGVRAEETEKQQVISQHN
ncbi:hypothetical protein ACJJTC_006659 [Scirpophaga incertulas]